MPLTVEQRVERLAVRLDELRYWTVQSALPIPDWTFNGAPIRLGDEWPTRAGVSTLRSAPVRVPEEWPAFRTRLQLDLGGEALVRVVYGGGEVRSFGLDPFHRRLPLEGHAFYVEAEAVARLPFGVPNRRPVLTSAQVVLLDVAVERLLRQLELVVSACISLGGSEVVEPLLRAGERAINGLDWPNDTLTYVSRIAPSPLLQEVWELPAGIETAPTGLSQTEQASVLHAIESLQRDLGELQARYPHVGTLTLVGHAHIDLAWLWPMDETVQKASRTFSTALSLLERFPEFTFAQSSAQLYAFIEEHDPELFARIRAAVATGRWEPVGGMWVEPDTIMPSGEALVRQLLYGQRYFESTFGRRHTVAWLPDCFGFTPALPQLLRQAGISGFFTIKLNWSESNAFPYDLFYWEGLDGSRVLAHMFNNPDERESETGGYNSNVSVPALLSTWSNYRGKHVYADSLLSVGYGDGGGGVTEEMVERAREIASFPALPDVKFGRVDEYFARLAAGVAGEELPVWSGDLYLELHRGTLTTQGRTKFLHRRAEQSLVVAETAATLAWMLGSSRPASLEPLWHHVLRNEFHDILPGSSIREVYERATSELSDVIADAGAVIDEAMAFFATQFRPGKDERLLLLNPGLVSRPIRGAAPSGTSGAQDTEYGAVFTAAGALPGLSITTLSIGTPAGTVHVGPEHLENDLLRVSVDEHGTISSVWDKEMEREVLSGRGNQIWAYVDKPRKWDAWDVDAGYREVGQEILACRPAQIIERGPHRVALRVEREFRNSSITQDIRLWAGSRRVDIATTVEWHDRRWLVRALFPVAVRAQHATFETAFGVIERPTHRNTSWEQARFEVAAHRFVDISEAGYGVALLNDGKYGHDVRFDEIGISLLRSPVYPDPLADEGPQHFTYSLFPHVGSWQESGVLAEAEDLNVPLPVRRVAANSKQQVRPIVVEGLPVALAALKPAESGNGAILRAYDPYGRHGQVSITPPTGWILDSTVNLLEDEVGPADQHITPFALRSWLLRSGEEPS